MDTNTMILLVVAMLAVLHVLSVIFIYKPLVSRWLDIKEKEQKIKKYELFNKVNADTVNEVLDNYIKTYISRYIVYKFMAQKVIYINKEDTETLIKDVTKEILLEISELYTYYITLIYSCNDDIDLATYIHSKVTNVAIDMITNFNSSNGLEV